MIASTTGYIRKGGKNKEKGHTKPEMIQRLGEVPTYLPSTVFVLYALYF